MANWWADQCSRVPLLTPSQEITLGQAVQQWLSHPPPVPPAVERRGRRARERFIRANLRLVLSVADRYRSVPVHYRDDLIQAGNLGLIKAVERFDPTRGYRFSTYAYWWIRQGINQFLERSSRTIALPTTHAAHLNRAANAAGDLQGMLGRPPSRSEVAEALGWRVEALERLLARPAATVSLEAPNQFRDDSAPIAESIADPHHSNPADAVELLEQAERLAAALATLPESTRRLVEAVYGLCGQPQTVAQVARAERLNSRRVSALIDGALRHLADQLEGMPLPPPSPRPPPAETPERAEQLCLFVV